MKVFLQLTSKKIQVAIFACVFFAFIHTPKVIASTPNEVYQSANNLVINIEKIRQNQNVNIEARKPGVQIAKTPIHAYTKALEVYEKIIRFKQLKNWEHSSLPNLPVKKVLPSDVFAIINDITKELDDINKKLNITLTKSALLPVGKTPSDVYERLWQSSYLLDGLVGAISPVYVYRNTIRIERTLINIANQLNKETKIKELIKHKGKKPIDANIEGYKVMYQLVALEKQLGMQVVRVSSFPAGNISPSDVYDTTNNIIAELTRINVELSLPAVVSAQLSKEKITPSEVTHQFKKIQSLLSNISS